MSAWSSMLEPTLLATDLHGVDATRKATTAASDKATTSQSPSRRLSTRRVLQAISVRPISRWQTLAAAAMVFAQLLWSLTVPIKNLVLIPWPILTEDTTAVNIDTASYPGMPSDTDAELVFDGDQVVEMLRRTLRTVLESPTITSQLMYTQSFSVDTLSDGLTNDQYEALNDYVMLIHQVSEFPGGMFLGQQQEEIEVVDATKVSGAATRSFTYVCPASDAKLAGAVCTNGNGEPCKFTAGEVQTFETVSLDTLRTKTSLENHFVLLMLVETFHRIMMSFFRTQQWSTTVIEFTDKTVNVQGSKLKFSKTSVPVYGHDASVVVNNSTVESCVSTDLMLGGVHGTHFLLAMIQNELMRSQISQAPVYYAPSALANARITSILQKLSMRITSGLRCVPRVVVKGKMLHRELTIIETTTCFKKLSRTLTSSPVLGRPMALLQSLFMDRGNGYRVTKTTTRSSVSLQHYLLGAYQSNMNSFKNDRVLMSNRMWKLRERTKAQNAEGHPVNRMYEIDEWMAPYLSRTGGKAHSLVELVDRHLEDMIPRTALEELTFPFCSLGLLYMLAQVSWLAMLKRNPLLFHLGWNTMISGGDVSTRARDQMMLYQVIAENSLGGRPLLYYEYKHPRESLWPIFPLLEQHRQEIGDSGLVTMILTQLNSSFPNVVLTEYDKVMFSTTNRCPINVGRHNITTTDTKVELYEKQYPTYRDVVIDLVAVLPLIVAEMDAAVGLIRVPRQYITGTPTYPLGIAKLEGPPVAFERTALTYALVRLTNKGIPTKAFMTDLSMSEQCYDAMDLRYLNSTVRCFQEDLTRTESIVRKNADDLRTFLYSNWSIGMVLNVLSMWLVLLHVKRVVHVARRTRLKDLTLWHAFHIHLQGPNDVPLFHLVMISASGIPLLVGYHLPFDASFMTQGNAVKGVVSETLVALGLTWFIRIGVEVGARVMYLSSPNPLSQLMLSRLRNVLLVPILAIRSGMPDSTYHDGMIKLICSCVISTALGFVGMIASRLWKTRSIPGGDWIGKALREAKASRSMYGTASYSPFDGWSVCAFMMEGWALRTVENRPVLVRDEHLTLELPDEALVTKPGVYKLSQMSNERLRSHPIISRESSLRSTSDTSDESDVMTTFYVTSSGGGVSKWVYALCLSIIVAQSFWTLVTPIINVLLLPYPTFLSDGTIMHQAAYAGSNNDTVVFTGTEVLDILNQTFQIVLDNSQVLQALLAARKFNFDTVAPALNNEEYAVMSNFTALFAQATMFPPSRFIAREEIFFYPDDTAPGGIDSVKYVCRPEFETLHGQRCVNSDGEVCGFSKTETGRSMSFVNLTATLQAVGVANLNTFSLNEAVTTFYTHVDKLFSLGGWTEYVTFFHRPEFKYAFIGRDNDTLIYNYEFTKMPISMVNVTDKVVYSCWASELLLMSAYLMNYMQVLIQAELLKRPHLQETFSVTEAFPTSPIVSKRIDLLRSRQLHITSGVRIIASSNSVGRFGSVPLTSRQSLSMSKKFTPSRLFGGNPGYPSRMIEYMMYYPDLYAFYNTTPPLPTVGQSEMMMSGSLRSGFNTFRDDYYGMSHRHFLLRERPQHLGPRLLGNNIDEDQVISSWFGRAQDRSISMRDVISSHLDDTAENKDCHAAMLFTIAQVTWLMALTDAPILTSLVFFATMNGARETAPWYLEQMGKTQVMGQTSLGQMRFIQYTDASNDPNAAWPIVPLLSIFRDVYGDSVVKTMFLSKLNSTFTTLVGAKDGRLDLNIRGSCPIGVKKYSIDSRDTLDTIYVKLYPAFVSIIGDLLRATPAIHDAMLKEVSSSLYIRRELITGTKAFPKPVTSYRGSPVFTIHTALSIGLMKLSTKNVPQQRDVRKLLQNEHCYDVLELRYLNVTVRCMFEDGSFTETRVVKESGRLRMLMSILWGLAAVLNIFSACVAYSVTRKIWRTYQQTRFQDINLYLARNIRIQGPSMISLNELLIMTAGCVPMLVGYYLPTNDEFIDAASKPNRIVRELLIAASLLWFVRLGSELSTFVVHLERQHFFSQKLQHYSRYALVVLVMALRPTNIVDDGDYNRGVIVAAATVTTVTLASLAIGVVGVSYARRRQRLKPAPVGEAKIPGDVMEEAFRRLGLNRLRHGPLGHTPKGWTLSGLLLEGWQPMEKAETLVLTYDRQLAALHIKDTVLVPVDQRPPELRATSKVGDNAIVPSGPMNEDVVRVKN